MRTCRLLRKAMLAEGPTTVAARIGCAPSELARVVHGDIVGASEPRAGGHTNIEAVMGAVSTIYGGKRHMQNIPEGYKRNAVGHLVPIESIKEEDLARDQFVQDMVARAQELSTTLQAFKKRVRDDFQAFLDLSAEKYEVTLGGEKGNVRLRSFDGRFEIIREVNELLDFDERLHVAKALVDECLIEWSAGLDNKIRTLIMSAFQVDSKGKINSKRVLGLRRYNFDDERWKRAMQAINDAIMVTGSCVYFRFYATDEAGKLGQVKLDFSGI